MRAPQKKTCGSLHCKPVQTRGKKKTCAYARLYKCVYACRRSTSLCTAKKGAVLHRPAVMWQLAPPRTHIRFCCRHHELRSQNITGSEREPRKEKHPLVAPSHLLRWAR